MKWNTDTHQFQNQFNFKQKRNDFLPVKKFQKTKRILDSGFRSQDCLMFGESQTSVVHPQLFFFQSLSTLLFFLLILFFPFSA